MVFIVFVLCCARAVLGNGGLHWRRQHSDIDEERRWLFQWPQNKQTNKQSWFETRQQLIQLRQYFSLQHSHFKDLVTAKNKVQRSRQSQVFLYSLWLSLISLATLHPSQAKTKWNKSKFTGSRGPRLAWQRQGVVIGPLCTKLFSTVYQASNCAPCKLQASNVHTWNICRQLPNKIFTDSAVPEKKEGNRWQSASHGVEAGERPRDNLCHTTSAFCVTPHHLLCICVFVYLCIWQRDNLCHTTSPLCVTLHNLERRLNWPLQKN